jgi:hypothetical protein
VTAADVFDTFEQDEDTLAAQDAIVLDLALQLGGAGHLLTPVTLTRGRDGGKEARFHRSKWQTGKEPDASADPQVIRDWWVAYPGTSFAIVCGEVSGIEGTDLDVKPAEGVNGLEWWSKQSLPLAGMVVETLSGGLHCITRRRPDRPLPTGAGVIASGVDTRSAGGCLFAPGAYVHGEPGHYQIQGDLVPVADLPYTPTEVLDLVPARAAKAERLSNGEETEHEREWIEAKCTEQMTRVVTHDRHAGGFRHLLLGAAMVVGRATAAGVVEHEDAVRRLRGAVSAVWGEPDAEDEEWIETGMEDGPALERWRVRKGPTIVRLPLMASLPTGESGQPDIASDTAGDGGQAEQIDARELEVRQELRRLEVREEARRRHRAGQSAARPPITSLDAFLAVQDEPVTFRIADLMPVGSRVLLAAQYKAGKTTLVANLLRALVDGVDFLGRSVTRPNGRVVLLDGELDERMLRRWLRDQRIRNTDRIAVVSLRGRLSSLNLLDPGVRDEWAAELRALDAGVVILDCLRPVLDALGLDEDKEAGRLCVAFDELLAAADVAEGLVVHHMGHQGERSRGSSRLRDWPDVEWKLVRQDDDPASARYFSAYGRDVDVPETALRYDLATRRLDAVGGTRQDSKARALVPAVLDVLAEADGPLTTRALVDLLLDVGPRDTVREAVALAVAGGSVRTEPGPRRSTLHRLTEPGSGGEVR